MAISGNRPRPRARGATLPGMDPLLREAIEPVLRDLRAYGIVPDQLDDEAWTEDPHRPSLTIWGTGHGHGVSVGDGDSPARRVAEAADRVQEWAIDELWGTGPAAWPPCPLHPNTHPLWVRVDGQGAGERAVWACPAESVAVAAVGTLSASGGSSSPPARRSPGGLGSLHGLGPLPERPDR